MIRRSLADTAVHRLAGVLTEQAAQHRAVAGDPAADTRFAWGYLLCDRLAAEMLQMHGTPEARALEELHPFEAAPDVVDAYVSGLGFAQHPQNARAMLAALGDLVLAKVTEPAAVAAPAA